MNDKELSRMLLTAAGHISANNTSKGDELINDVLRHIEVEYDPDTFQQTEIFSRLTAILNGVNEDIRNALSNILNSRCQKLSDDLRNFEVELEDLKKQQLKLRSTLSRLAAYTQLFEKIFQNTEYLNHEELTNIRHRIHDVQHKRTQLNQIKQEKYEKENMIEKLRSTIGEWLETNNE